MEQPSGKYKLHFNHKMVDLIKSQCMSLSRGVEKQRVYKDLRKHFVMTEHQNSI